MRVGGRLQVPPPPVAPPSPPGEESLTESLSEEAEDVLLEMMVWCFLGVSLVAIPAGAFALVRSVRFPAAPRLAHERKKLGRLNGRPYIGLFPSVHQQVRIAAISHPRIPYQARSLRS
jgi:hypothetical protein